MHHQHLNAAIRTPAELTAIIESNNVDTLISGGVGASVRRLLGTHGIHIVDNISLTTEELLRDIPVDKRFYEKQGTQSIEDVKESCPYLMNQRYAEMNCLSCSERGCLLGRTAENAVAAAWKTITPTERHMLEAAMDIANESPRRLCRLSEIIYFCIEMNYQRLGLAYCTELEEAARILVNVLGRFFKVVPVCCKVGGIRESALYSTDDAWMAGNPRSVVCNPLGQADVLNRAETQFNLVVGLCVGADALFGHATKAPASTLFVKDKSLANNPIGALYSEYYLKESVSQAAGRQPNQDSGNRREET